MPAYSEVTPRSYTEYQMNLAAYLQSLGIQIAIEFPIPRWNEWHETHGYNSKTIWELKQYRIDILLFDPRYTQVALEAEGKGSASADNQKREAYLLKLGIPTLHIRNGTPFANVASDLEHFKRPEE